MVLHQLLHLVPWWQTRKKMQDSLQLDEGAAGQVPQFSTAAGSQGDVKVSDILLSEENPAMASAHHETHVATNTARSSATAPIVPLTRLIKRPQGKYRSFRQPRRHRAM